MTFGYALLGALVLLLPGFAAYYGMRVGEASNLGIVDKGQPQLN